MAAVLKVLPFPQGIENTQRRIHVAGTATITGTYAAGGFATTWTSMVDATTGEAILLDTNATTPIMAYFTSMGGSGYIYGWNKATNKVQIFTVDAVALSTQYPLSELAAGTVPTGVSSDTIVFEAEFVRAIL